MSYSDWRDWPDHTREAIEARVDKSEECWRWPTAMADSGRALVKFEGTKWLVQRLLYTWAVGPIPKSAPLERTCEHVWCVNPAHGRLNSAARNVSAEELRDWARVDAVCPAGHPRVKHGRRDRGRRLYCAECRRIKAARYDGRLAGER
ncbi:hypothetical protein AERO9AM_50387 [Aeromicrobium sp. 9AM]|nr:hypothetical protein AERO9AM_50387 [Aeromicrobium sp. 9AM]